MNNLHNLLERFKTLIHSSKDTKTQIKTIIAREATVDLQEGQLDLRDSTLFITAHSGTKNALFMRKKKLLEAFEKELGKNKVKDIR